MQISKSEYLMFLRHPVLIWLKKHDKNKLPPIDANLQAIFDAGNLFEGYAEQLFDGGIRLGFSNYNEYLSLPARTTAAIDGGASILFQARFETPLITCICDVVEIIGDKELNLYEIKSGTSVKPENIYDLAFQAHVLHSCGYNVNTIKVIHVNNQFVRRGEIKPRELCIITDVTEEVFGEIEDTIALIQEAHDVIALKKMPELIAPLDEDGDLNAWLEIYLHLNPAKPGSIFDLCWPKNRVAQLHSMGIEKLTDIPEDFALSPKQKFQVQAAKSNQEYFELESIASFVNNLQFPLYFLDYETLTGVIPPFDGLSPYKQLPFQYSLHVLQSTGKLEHFTYLHRENSDPTIPLSASLAEHIGTQGTILTWNDKFEKSCNDLMGKMAPKYKKFYKDINLRVDDLCIPFQKSWYVHKDFLGSYSIKKVLPVVVPELSYTDLDINEGAGAQRLWMQSVLEEKPGLDKEKILSDLDKYCELDTLAMVKIYEVLVQLTSADGQHLGDASETHKEKNTEVAEKLSLF